MSLKEKFREDYSEALSEAIKDATREAGGEIFDEYLTESDLTLVIDPEDTTGFRIIVGIGDCAMTMRPTIKPDGERKDTEAALERFIAHLRAELEDWYAQK